MKAIIQLLAILLTINLTWAASSLLDKIKDDPDLSQVIDNNVHILSSGATEAFKNVVTFIFYLVDVRYKLNCIRSI